MDIDRDFVIDQLERVCSETKMKRNDIVIICPFHADSSPSCEVHISGHKINVGSFHCWSCDASGPWGKLADKLGLEGGEGYTSKNPFSAKSRAVRQAIADMEEHSKQEFHDFMPLNHEPWTYGEWRGLPESFLVEVGARRFYDDRCECHRIIFPIKDRHKINIGSVARRLDRDSFMPWFNAPGPWARNALFPIHMLPKPLDRVVLVEGPFDALRLNYLKIPALSILGTSNWNRTKLGALRGWAIKTAIICMDGDVAGRKCEEKIFNDLKGSMKRKRFRLPFEQPSIDPGSMNLELVEALRDFAGFGGDDDKEN